ncbi:hypothetical protein C8R45DRAFT_1091919 [Mycena sanguinolenta]|nr:hypothetical protein C8R45DRAFT_1091919 [Mycena sanguinolenta]
MRAVVLEQKERTKHSSKANIERFIAESESRIVSLHFPVEPHERERACVAALRHLISPIHTLPVELMVEIFDLAIREHIDTDSFSSLKPFGIFVQSFFLEFFLLDLYLDDRCPCTIPDILGEIFLECIPPLGNSDDLPAYFPYTLSHVCRHWRAAALSFPKLWSFLDVEQTDENEEGNCAVIEAYLERSGNHPLTFRLAYAYETINSQTFLECLDRHAARWQNVFLEGPNYSALKHLALGKPSDYPLLRSFVCTYCDFNSDAVHDSTLFNPIPWAQLERYHEYEVSWSEAARQCEILTQLTNVVDLRVTLSGEYEFEDDDEDEESPFKMPRLRFASLAIDKDAEGVDMKELLKWFELPCIQGLNLKLMDGDVLIPVPHQLKHLKILRLCGSSCAISNPDLLALLTEIETLTDLAVDLCCVDSAYFFELLGGTPDSVSLAVQLRALRTTHFKPVAGAALDALLRMLRQRFARVEYTRLERFEFFLGQRLSEEWDAKNESSTMFDDLESLRVHEGWDIRVLKDWLQYDFWREEMDEEFL